MQCRKCLSDNAAAPPARGLDPRCRRRVYVRPAAAPETTAAVRGTSTGTSTSRTTTRAEPRPPRRGAIGRGVAAAIVGLIVVVHVNGVRGPFVFDDVTSIRENPNIRSLWPPWRPMTTPPDRTISGRPVAAVSFALNYAVGGLDPRGYHVVNLWLHVANALLAFTLIRRTLEGGRLGERAAREAPWIAGAAAAIWGVHPLAGGAVTYLVQRTELLAGLFLLVLLHSVANAAVSKRPWRWGAIAIAASALGMGSKEYVVVAPLLAVLYDAIFLAGSLRGALRARRWLYAGLACTWLVLVALLATNPHGQSAGFSLARLSAWEYARTQPEVILHYLRLAAVPHPLSIDYADWPIADAPLRIVSSFLAVAALVAATAWALLRKPAIGFLGAWFFLLLAPTSSVLPLLRELAAERRMYVPLAAIVTLAVVGASAALRSLGAPVRRVVGWGAVACVVAVFGGMTSRRNLDFRTEAGLWEATVATRPGNARARNNLGYALYGEGRLVEALPHLARAVEIEPDYADAWSNLGGVLYTLGRVPEAIPALEAAIRLNASLVVAHYNLALAYHVEGRTQDAVREYREILRLSPGDVDARTNLGVALHSLGRVPEALSQLREALRLRPGDPTARAALARITEGPGTSR